MKVGIHQINYFPWLGYFNKIAKCELFILLDQVQLVDNNMMHRNRYLNQNGEISYFTIAFNKKGYMSRQFSEIELNQGVDWQTRQMNALKGAYMKAPYWKEVIEIIEPVFSKQYDKIIDVNEKALQIVINLLDINTKLVKQSDLDVDITLKKDEMLVELLSKVEADIYLSGSGAKKYMNISDFNNRGIEVQFQTFSCPVYPQLHAKEFVPGLSILDMLFNCGIENTKDIFWRNIQNNEIVEV